MGRLCYPTQFRPKQNPKIGVKFILGRIRRVWRTFCNHGTKVIRSRCDRGTNCLGAANKSPITKLDGGTGAVSRYKLSRSQKFILVQDLSCVQMSASGCNKPLRICLECRSKSKKCDKQLTHIVRVMVRYFIHILLFCQRFLFF